MSLAVLVAACSGASADPNAPAPAKPAKAAAKPADCSKAAKRKARAAASQAVAAADYPKAIALLEPFRACNDTADRVESAWLAGDLAVAYEKNGQPLECERLMGPLSHPKSGVLETGNDKLIKALEYNLDHCSKTFDAQYAAIKAGGCTLAIDKAIASAAVPAPLIPKGATAACLALVPGKPVAKSADDDPDQTPVVCPRVALVWKSARPALERQELTSGGDHDALGNESDCCNLSTIAVGVQAGKPTVRVRGDGRDCTGGTADSSSDMFYEWKGAALSATLDASIVRF